MTIEDAGSWIADVLKARVEAVAVHPQGGWTFEARGIPFYGSSLVDNHDSFDYCLLDTENDEEVGRHHETMMFERLDPESGDTLLLSGHYSRALGDHDDNADARFDGRMGLAGPQEVERMRGSFRDDFSDRTIEGQLQSMGYVGSGLQTALHYRRRELTEDMRERLLRQVTDMNRVVLDLLGMTDAA